MLLTILLCYFSRVSHIFGSPIIGGVDAEERKYKYQVSLQEIDRKIQHYCGGSIISDCWILTAAHCVDNDRIRNNIKRIQIVVGIIRLNDDGEKYFVKSCQIHENWDLESIANDIALLETTEKIKFSAAIQPIALATHNPPDRTSATLAGWGFTSVNILFNNHFSNCLNSSDEFFLSLQDNAVGVDVTPIPNALQVAHFETISLQECRKQFNDAKYPGKLVIRTNICIAQPASKAQCNGDSGGGIITNNWTQIGIVSFGGQCSDGVPGVATSVAKYLNWIKEKSGI